MWVPIALGRDIPDGSTRAILLGGKELVAWRASSGSVQVWEDRCPHRGMRLSFGFVRGDGLNCLYHGWEYGAAASCRRIPAHPDLVVPQTIRARALPACECAGLIWTNDGAEPGAPELPDMRPVGTICVDAAAGAILDLCAAAPISGTQAFATNLDGMTLQIGWHEVTPDRTMLHAGLPGDGSLRDALIALHGLRALAERRTGS